MLRSLRQHDGALLSTRMDPVTQGLLGAAVSQSIAKHDQIRLAAGIGFVAGIAPDVDILIHSSQDPLLGLEMHRHFTHSLIFIPIGALIVACLAYLVLRHKQLNFYQMYVYAIAAYATSGLLDACTNYGTQLLWPFSNTRIAWNIISVVDPLFTLILIVSVVLCLWLRSAFAVRNGLVFALAYLMIGLIQKERVEDVVYQLAKYREHVISRVEVMPSLGNLLLWRTIYQHDESFYIDAVRLVPFADLIIYEGASAKVYNPDAALARTYNNSNVYRDIKRFKHFANGYIVTLPEDSNIIGDLRYAPLPNTLQPLWGIKIDLTQPEEHVQLVSYRFLTGERFRTFFDMVMGKEIKAKP